MAFTNGRAPRIVGTASGLLPPVIRTATVDTSTTAVGDLVGPMAAGAWPVYAAKGAVLGGIYLGRDAGSVTGGAVVIPTPGVDAFGVGVYTADGPTGAAATYGAVQVITPDCYVEIDLLEGTTMTTLVPGLTGLSLLGATRVSASSGGWYVELDANSGNGLDSCCTLMEVISPCAAAAHGRVVVRFNLPSVLSCQFTS